MHARDRACMQAACMATLILALGACDAAAELVKLHDDRQLPADQHAGRHLLQSPGCPGPYCPGGPAQTGPAQMAGPGGGGAAAGAAAGSPSARAAPTMATPAALGSPAAAGAVSSPGLSPDASALQFFQQGIANWRELKSWGFKGWDFASSPCQGWSGVSCDTSGRVSKLDLAGWGIKGRLAPELAGLAHLQHLTLENNNITGGLSSTWGAPGVFQSLVEMDLSQNWNLNGILLSQWGSPGAFPRLQMLNLSNSGLTGDLPALWGVNGSLPSLTTLDVSRNGVSGSLPIAWAVPGALASLETLAVSANNLSGPLPVEWGASPGAFPALKTLDVRQNGLEGYLPDAWGTSFQNVSELALQQNIFEGQLPMDWAQAGRWPNLAYLQLWNNSLSGSIPASWNNVTALPALKVLALKPGNGDLCGTVPQHIVNTTGLRSSYLGNCTGLPLRPQRALPPAAGLNATLAVPAQAPNALLARLPGAVPTNISAPGPAPGALIAPPSVGLAPQAIVAPQPAALLPAANATAPAITAAAVLPAIVATSPVLAPAVAVVPMNATSALGRATAPGLPQPSAAANSTIVALPAPTNASANATALAPGIPIIPVPVPAAVTGTVAPKATAGAPVAAAPAPANGSVLQLPAAQQSPISAPAAAAVPPAPGAVTPAPAPAPASPQPHTVPVSAVTGGVPSATPAAAVPVPTPAPTPPPMGAGQAAMAAAGSSLSIGVPSPPPPMPTAVPTPRSTPDTQADSPMAVPAGPPALFVPPGNSDGTTSYLQASYNLTGANLSATNATLTKRIQTALQKALGANVNATLLKVAAAGGAAESSPSPADALTGPSLTPADGSTAGAGRRLLAPQNSAGAMVAGVGNTDLPADSSASATPASSSGADTAAAPADAGLGDPSAAGPPPAGAGAGVGAGQAGRASWAGSVGSSPAASQWVGSDAVGPSPPAQRRRDATVAAYFLITTLPDQMAAIARNISLTQTASRFDQQLRLAGLPITHTRFSGVSQIASDGTLRAINGASPAAAASPATAAAASPAASAAPTPMITPAADTSGFLTGSQPVASASPGPSASSGPNTGAIAGGVVGALAAVIIAALAGMYIMRKKRQQRSSGKALVTGNHDGGNDAEAGKGGSSYMGDGSHAQPDQDKVAAMLASMKADAARSVSQRQASGKPEDYAGGKAMSGKKGSAPAAAAAAAGVAGKLAEDSAHERDDNSESTVSEDSLNRLGARQGSGSIEEIRRHQGDPQADGQQRYLEKGKGKMIERRRTDSASSLRSVLRGRDGTVIGDGVGPSSSSEGGSGSMPGSAPESLSGSEGMAPIKTRLRMAPQGSGPAGEKYLRGDSSSGRAQSGTPPPRSRPGLSGPHHAGPARAPLSPYSSGSNGRGHHSSSRSRSGNILAHLAAELEKAEASGGVDRLMGPHGSQGSRGGPGGGANSGRSRRSSDPDLLSALGYSSQREQHGRALTAGEYAAVLAARDRQRARQSRGDSRHGSASRELMRSESGAPLQELVRSISGNREGHGQSQEQLLRTLEQRLGLRGPGGGHQGSSHHRGSSSGRPRSSNLSNLEPVGSAGSEQRLYRGTRSDGIDRVNSQGSNISGLGGPMESVGEDQEMKGSDWASAMRILTDMEHDQEHDRHDRRCPREDTHVSSGSSRRRGGGSRRE